MTLIGDDCNAGAALFQIRSTLFGVDAGDRKRFLVVLLVGKSSDQIPGAAEPLTSNGVHIISIGIGFSTDTSQLQALSFPRSSYLTVASIADLDGLAGGTSALISEGKFTLHF